MKNLSQSPGPAPILIEGTLRCISRILFLGALVTAFSVTHVSASKAATIECTNAATKSDVARAVPWPSGYRLSVGDCFEAFIHGAIAKGDYEKTRRFFHNNYRALGVVDLQSPGGDAQEAMAIGRLLRKYLVRVVAPFHAPGDEPGPALYGPPHRVAHSASALCRGPDCICASACAIIWFGAPRRLGTVGLHRPQISDPEFTSLSAAQAMRVYRQVLYKIARYMDEMEVPRTVTEAMMGTDSGAIRWVYYNRDKLEQAPSFAEWVDASCGHFTDGEFSKLAVLWSKRKTRPLSRNDEMLYQLLSEKESRRLRCELDLINMALDKLPPP